VSEVFEFLANPTNLEILRVLAGGCAYPREIARVLGRDESVVSRRLRRAEELGLVKSERVILSSGSRRVSVRKYCLAVDRISVDLRSGAFEAQASPAPGAARRPGVARPIGRDLELARVARAAEGLRVLAVYGPPMSGKTHFVRYVVGEYFRGRPVVWVTASPGVTVEQFSRLLALALARAGIAVDVEGFDIVRDREWLADALARANAVLVVDDAQYALRDSRLASLLRWLAGAALTRGFTLVIASRSRLEGLAPRRPGVLELELGPVHARAFAEIASARSGSEVSLEEVEEVAARVPLLPGLAVLYASLLESSTYRQEAIERLATTIALGLESVASASPLHEAIVEVLAAAGAPVPDWALCEAARALVGGRRWSLRECMGALRELVLAGVVRLRGREAYLDEPFTRAAAEKAAAHAHVIKPRLGRILAGSEDYHHRGLAARLLVEACDIAGLVELVAERLRSGSRWPFAVAGEYTRALRRALAECPLRRVDAALLAAELALLESMFDDPKSTGEALRRAYEEASRGGRGDPVLLARLASLAGLAMAHAGEYAEAERLLDEAAEHARESGDAEALLTYYNNRIALLLARATAEGDRSLVEEAYRLAMEMEEAVAEAGGDYEYKWALSVRGDLEITMGDVEAGLEILRRLYGVLREGSYYHVDPLYYNVAVSLAYALAIVGDVDAALAILREAQDAAVRISTAFSAAREILSWLVADTAIMLALRGDVEAAARSFPREKCAGPHVPRLWKWRCSLYKALVEGKPPERLNVVDGPRLRRLLDQRRSPGDNESPL